VGYVNTACQSLCQTGQAGLGGLDPREVRTRLQIGKKEKPDPASFAEGDGGLHVIAGDEAAAVGAGRSDQQEKNTVAA
jgi:hypothetical protein